MTVDLKELTSDQLRELRGQVERELGDSTEALLQCPGVRKWDKEYGTQEVLETCDYTHTTHAAKCPKHGISLV